MLKVFTQANLYENRIAIESENKEYSYKYILDKSDLIASFLLGKRSDLLEQRIGILVNPNIDYVTILWGIWKSGGVAVPLCLSATENELKHYISDSGINIIISSKRCEQKQNIPNIDDLELINIENLETHRKTPLPKLSLERRAMIIYTSGTTNKPKGVVSTHKNIEAQITALTEAWHWNKEDHIPLFLPLHHIHGIINSLCCPLFVGAKTTMLESFNVDHICEEVSSKDFTVFTAVPTIYFSLIDKLETSNDKNIINGFRKMRLMMSGSAALAPEIHKKWKKLTGQELLERYGMTEVGMALSNKIDGERRPGSVGIPLPGVEIKLEDDEGKIIINEGEAGQVMIRGPQVFLEYINLSEKTKDSFKEGWFLTGDVALLEKGYFRLLGRDSIDVIKSGGYKIAALEIEDTLLRHPNIKECAVIGKKDDKWGEIVVSAIVIREKELSIEEVQKWCSKRLSGYKIPRIIKIIKELPKNSMGKIRKIKLKKLF
jgi:malonyl-CoA/methylmalonyl-CoA synthetase|tara:strand:- start:233 stop:1699 length:1467 start_codon:yes stop_codon:yes gene_type:complete